MKSNHVVEILTDDERERAEPQFKRHKRNNKEITKAHAEVSPCSTLCGTTEGKLAFSEAALDGRTLYIGNGTGNVVSEQNILGLHNDSQYKHVIHPGPSAQLHGDSSPIQTCFKDESKHVDLKDKDAVAGVSYSSQLDIVSSDNGEAKMSLTFNSSIKCDTGQMLSLDAVLEVAEDKIRDRYGISDAEFSVKKLLREFCECFLAMGTNDVHVLPMSDRKKSDSEVLANGENNKQSNFKTQPCHSHGLVDESQDRIDKETQVSEPMHVDSCNGKEVVPGNTSNEIEKKNHPPLNVTKSFIFVEDITRGEERQPISLVSDNCSLKLPKFFYISKNIVFRTAYVNFSLARISDHNCCSNCFGNCLSAPATCACTGETRGDFAYTPCGLLDDKFLDECIGMSRRMPTKDHLYYCEHCPLENSIVKNSKQQKRKRLKKSCKGHLMRKFIKECWAKCGCNRTCGNRVVQRGITVKLQVFQTPEGKGWGLRTLEPLEKGTFVCEYVGEIVTNQELHERNEESAGEEHTYPVLLDADWASERHLKDEEALCLDATNFGNVARFINHRCCDANLVEIPVEVETPDHHYYHIAFFTNRKIELNEELTWDYGIDFDDETHPIKAFECKCGSLFCCKKNRSSC